MQWEPGSQAACSTETLMKSQFGTIHLQNCSKEAPCNAVAAAVLSYDPGVSAIPACFAISLTSVHRVCCIILKCSVMSCPCTAGTYRLFLDSYRAQCPGSNNKIVLFVNATDVQNHSKKMCKAVQEQGVAYIVLEEDTRSSFETTCWHWAYLSLHSA